MTTSLVPVSHTSFASQTAEEAWDVLSRMYTQARPHAASPDAAVRFDGAATPEIAVDRGWLDSASGSFDESPEQLNFISVVQGRISLDFGRRGAVANVAGDSYLYPPDSRAELEWDGFGALTVRLSPQLVARLADELTGVSSGAVQFTSPRPLSAGHARLWLQTVRMLWAELAASDTAGVPALVHQELVNVTAAAALSVFPNSTMTRAYAPGPGDVRPAALRRAVAYIDAHAARPLTVSDVAHAAGVSPRALQVAFRRHYDTTPMGYLRRVRLEAAHRDLQAADPASGATVQAIAARWGFAKPDRFSAVYRRTFGVVPSRTLRG